MSTIGTKVEAVKRLRKEWREIVKSPPDYIIATPDEADMLTWHYVLLGPEDTPYEGGVYMGCLIFKPDYPLSPPRIIMKTPSGRFKPNDPICTSMSDFHPESWSPSWSVSSILIGLLSFFVSSERTAGSIDTTVEEKRHLAAATMDFNKTVPTFNKYFPHLISDV